MARHNIHKKVGDVMPGRPLTDEELTDYNSLVRQAEIAGDQLLDQQRKVKLGIVNNHETASEPRSKGGMFKSESF